MSFSTALDAFRARVASLSGFTTKTELPDAYDLENNADSFLRNGWGVAIGDSARFSAEYNSVADLQTFSVVLTTEVLKTDKNPDPLTLAVKSLKADAKTLMVDLEENDLGDPSVDLVQYASTSAIEFLATERARHITLTVNFSVVIRETF